MSAYTTQASASYQPSGTVINCPAHEVSGKFSDFFLEKGPEVEGWKTKLRLHLDAQTDLSYISWKHDVAMVNCFYHRFNIFGTTRHFSVDGYYPGFETVRSFATQWRAEEYDFLDESQKAFLGRLETEALGFMEVAFLGELGKTMDMLKNPLEGIGDLIRSLLRNLTSAKTSKEVASLWLKFNFGVRPFISDGQAIIYEFEKKLQEETLKWVGKEYKRSFTETGTLASVELGNPSASVPCLVRPVASRYSTVWIDVGSLISAKQVKAYYDARPGALFDEIQREIAASIWELTKLSWLFDYFVSVDTAVSARRALAGRYAYMFSRLKRETTVSYRLEQVNPPTSGITFFRTIDGTGKVEALAKQRIKGNVNSMGEISFMLPSGRRNLNVLALLLQYLNPY